MSLKVYCLPKSGHSHRVRLAVSLMKIDADVVSVADMDGGRTGSEYLAVNPLGQVPAIDHDGFVLSDSLAVLRYLAETFAPESGWVPTDAHDRAKMDQWFGVAAGEVFHGPNTARLIKLFGVDRDYDLAKLSATKLFELMEATLTGRDWLVDAQVTLADIACYSYVAVAHEGALNLTPYANIQKWLANMRGLDGFVEMPMAA